MLQKQFIYLLLYINKKFFFRKQHPFNQLKNWVLDINYSDFEYEHAKDFLAMYKDFIDLNELKNKKVLEIWCWGWWKSIYISKNYETTWVWIDLSEDFLLQANNKSKKLWLEAKLEFKKEDALNMWFKDWEFDFIILSDVIEHIPNTKKLLGESYRVLKKWWYILFDFAPYYHYFWHHIWDTIQIPWLHLFTTEAFRIKLYKKSLESFEDKNKRLNLRIWIDKTWKNSFTYLNKIKRKDFENLILDFWKSNENVNFNINYYMLKNLDIFSKIPFLREVFIRHIVWIINKK